MGLNLVAWRARWAAWRAGGFGASARWPLALDFVGPRPRTAWWAWALLVAGLASVLWVAGQAEALRGEHEAAQADLKRLSQADRRMRLQRALDSQAAGGGRQPGRDPAPALTQAAMDEALRMMRLRAHPWRAVLADVEQAALAPRAVLLSLSLDLADGAPGAAPPRLRLQAALRDDASALAWAAAMPSGQLLSRAALATPFTTPHGVYALKADAQALGGIADGTGAR